MTLQPAFQILRRAARMALRHGGFFARISLPWALILMVLPLFLVIASGGSTPAASQGAAASVSLGLAIFCYVLLCVMVVIYLAIAWFRRTLPYGNPKLRRRLPTTHDVLDFAAVLARILVYLAPIAFILSLVTLGAVMLFAVWMVNALEGAPDQLLDLGALTPFRSPVGLPMLVILLALWLRLSLALSSSSVGKRDVDLTRAWLMTRGMSRQFLAVAAGLMIVALAIALLLAIAVEGLTPFLTAAEHSLGFMVLRYVLTSVGAWVIVFAMLAVTSSMHIFCMARLREIGDTRDSWRSDNGLVRA
jgi:hypothetical protein